MPQGDKRSPGWEFYDSTYDGYWETELRRGLGQLTDGKVGPDNFRTGYYDIERGTFTHDSTVAAKSNKIATSKVVDWAKYFQRIKRK